MAQMLVAFGFVFVLLGVAATLRPRWLQAMARRITVKTWLRLLVASVRFTLGGFLLIVARSTAYPLAFAVIGMLLLASGAAVLVLGNDGVQRIMTWAFGLGPAAVVGGGIVGIAFGGFLIYAGW